MRNLTMKLKKSDLFNAVKMRSLGNCRRAENEALERFKEKEKNITKKQD